VTECAETSNFQIARKLKDEKSRLINALSQFPRNCFMVTQWIWGKEAYEDLPLSRMMKQPLESELTRLPWRDSIKKQFHSLSRQNFEGCLLCSWQANLETALQLFPLFSFSWSVKTGSILLFTLISSEDLLSTQHSGENNSDLILKRWKGWVVRSSINASKWSWFLLSAYDEQFLFVGRVVTCIKYFSEWIFFRTSLG